MDFGAMPPEINSGRMYSGAGSVPMTTAASAWKGLAAELHSAALAYGSVLSSLVGEEWHGPASVAMATAAKPYVTWMTTTAAQAEQTAAQAETAAAAFEAAFAATVPPPVIAANRAQLAALVAANVLGQNTPAIAATEAHYGEMWAQDAAAMYSYAGASATATRLTPFAAPAQNTNLAGLAAQTASVAQTTGTSGGTSTQSTLSQLTSAVPSALQSLASTTETTATTETTTSTSGVWGILNLLAGNNTSTTGVAGLFNDIFSSNGLGLNDNLWNTIFSSGFYMPGNFLGNMVDFLALNGASTAAGEAAGQAAGAAAVEGLGAGGLGGVGGLGNLGAAASGALGHASVVGPLSVPPSWTAPAPLSSPLASMLGGTPMVAPPPTAGVPGMPGLPLANAAGNGLGRAIPQYGFRPTFVARPPAAG